MFTGVAVPTPFQAGPVNAYLAGRTVVDPGPDSEAAWTTLVDGLADRDLVPGDVEQILLTHPHPDHFGIAARLRERGATVVASPAAARIVEDFAGRLAHEQAYFLDFFERCGMDAETAETVTQLPEAFLHYAESVDVDREVDAGDDVTVADRRLAVDALAGHAPGERRFTNEDDGRRVSLVGDHVLPRHSPNPFLQPPDSGDSAGPAGANERPRVLPAYNDSLARLREHDLDRLLPGHGESIADPRGRIDEILAHNEARTERVADVVDGPTTPVAVMESLFEGLPATEQFAGMSEAVGHLDVLEDRGSVEQYDDGGRVVYEPVE